MDRIFPRRLWLGLTVLGYCVAFLAAAPQLLSAEEDVIELANRQQQIFRDYERFEKTLYDIAEQTRRKDPERAELLYRARGQSQEQRILTEMQAISALLNKDPKYGDALDRQKDLIVRMQSVLKLLQSLDERERIAGEIARINDLLKDTNRLLAGQKDVNADTQRGGDPGQLGERQEKVADQAQKLAEKIDRQDSERKAERESRDGSNPGDPKQPGDESKPSDGEGSKGDPMSGDPMSGEPMPGDQESKPGEPKPGEGEPAKPGEKGDSPMPMGDMPPMGEPSEGKPSEGKPSEGKPSEGKPSEGKPSEGKPSEGKPSEGKPSEGKPSEGQPSEGQPSEGQPSESDPQEQDQTRGREELEQARKEMQQALEELKGKDLKGADADQEQAIAQLEKMKAELEELLRQLREEEKEMYLTQLEARFQNMLRRQLVINTETIRLDGIPTAERPSTFGAKVEVVKRQEDENVLDAAKALSLLKEDGTSVAFPEAVEQMQSNMENVSRRLSHLDTADTTQLIEQLIVESLEEMIFALQQELEKMQEKKDPGPSQPPQPPQDPSLVNQLAELKMIRSLQNQINRLTRQIGLKVDGEQAADAEQVELLQDLSRRQERIQEATYDLSVGRNQ